MELQDLSKAELLRDLVMDPLPTPPSRDSRLATLVPHYISPISPLYLP